METMYITKFEIYRPSKAIGVAHSIAARFETAAECLEMLTADHFDTDGVIVMHFQRKVLPDLMGTFRLEEEHLVYSADNFIKHHRS